MKRIATVVVTALLVVVGGIHFGSGAAQAKPRGRVPRYGSIALRVPAESRAQQLDVEISEQLGRHRERLVESVSVGVASGDSYRWNRARTRRNYRVRVVERTSSSEVANYLIRIPVDADAEVHVLPALQPPVDPQDAQIAALQAQNLALQSENGSLQQQIAGLLAQLHGEVPIAFAVNRNPDLVLPTYLLGATQQRLASFTLTTPEAQGATLFTLTFDRDSNPGSHFKNLRILVEGNQFAVPVANVPDTWTVQFGGGPYAIPAGTTVTVDVVADVLSTSSAGTYESVFDLKDLTADWDDGSKIALTFPVAGQDIVLSE